MPPKIRITKEDIIQTAIELLRENGESTINARSIAAALNCSTQPVFSNFETMEKLHEEVVVAAYERYLHFLQQEAKDGRYPKYKAFGMAYIRFAKEEKQLFRLLFMRERKGGQDKLSIDYKESIEMIMSANGISREKAEKLHFEMWTCVHGIATMYNTSFLELNEEIISDVLSDIYQGLRARHLGEGV